MQHAGAPDAVVVAAYLVGYAAGGYSGARNAWRSLRGGRLNVDVLMLIAAAGAAALGAWLEGGMLLFLFSLSEALQSYAMGRTETALTALMDLRPDVARVRRDGEALEVPVEQVRTGDLVVVLPSERIPVDGLVVEGASDVDQAPITGESMPVSKVPGDAVFAATINGPGSMVVRTTRAASESTVARIIALVAEARAARAPTQRFIDRFGERYAWGVILMSAATFVVTVGPLGWTSDEAFYRAITLLVVASPCALVISTPASYLSAIANGARNGILFKGGVHLESAALTDAIAIDKTGTLTTGRPAVTDVLALAGHDPATVLELAAAVEGHSEHLLAAAVLAAAGTRGVDVPQATGARAMPGLGVSAMVGGRRVTVASPRLLRRGGALDDELERRLNLLEGDGKTTMVVLSGDTPVGLIAAADEARPAARSTLEALRAMGMVEVVMLTGDNERVAHALARTVNVPPSAVRADLMPAEKVAVVEEIAARRRVAFVGDGANDAPALAAAHLGIAMGGTGTDVALETADVVLMGDRIERLEHLFGLGRAARRIVKQNVAFSLGAMAVLVVATLWHGIALPVGVVGHEGSTVIVVLNGLRLLRYGRAWPAAANDADRAASPASRPATQRL